MCSSINTTFSGCRSQITKSNFREKSKVKERRRLTKAQTGRAARKLLIVFQRCPHTLEATIHGGLVFQLPAPRSEDGDVTEQEVVRLAAGRLRRRGAKHLCWDTQAELGQPSKTTSGRCPSSNTNQCLGQGCASFRCLQDPGGVATASLFSVAVRGQNSGTEFTVSTSENFLLIKVRP